MTQEEFKKILDEKGYSYREKGDKTMVDHIEYVDLSSLEEIPSRVKFENGGGVDLESLEVLPPGVKFENGGGVWLSSLKVLPPGVEFNNEGDVDLESLIGGWYAERDGNIEGIYSRRLLNKMIELGLFDRR